MKTYMKSVSGEVFQTTNPEWHKDSENLGPGQNGYAARQEYAKECLREMIKPGDTVYYNVNSVSSSGMSRNISFYIVAFNENENGRAYIRGIDSLMSDAIGIKEGKHGGLVFGGCGMNMGFSGVYSLGRALYPNGFGTMGEHPITKKTRATSAKHAQALIKKGYVFRGRNGDATGWDNDGGYSLGYSSL